MSQIAQSHENISQEISTSIAIKSMNIKHIFFPGCDFELPCKAFKCDQKIQCFMFHHMHIYHGDEFIVSSFFIRFSLCVKNL